MEHRNRLSDSLSPYLLQHADNPVDWYPWGEAAFRAAREGDKPIFLSVGYATCHWCHVMAHESFEDPEIAALMNEAFINVKVDREERPDVDQVYMTVTQMLTGGGGWPMTVIMTPDQRPFFAATYIPPSARWGRPGMLDLIPRVSAAWRDNREALIDSAADIVSNLQGLADRADKGAVGETTVAAARRDLGARFDDVEGGFSAPPKFPSPHNLLFLLAFGTNRDDDEAIGMATFTLEKMRRGGLFDHLGYGFHRYSTDREWLVPHFEKMLYDQAMLLLAFAEAYRVTSTPEFARTAVEVASYVQRDLGAPVGGFYSAEDADSEGREGAFYLWSDGELADALGDDDAAFARAVWNTRPNGNFAPEHGTESRSENILHLDADLDSEPVPDTARLERIRRELFDVRGHRPRPLRDDKILTDWNGLMAAALARAGTILDDRSMIESALETVGFIDTALRDPGGRLLHRYRNGSADIPAFADDYAFLIWALLELYGATFDLVHLERALALQTEMDERFWDERQGGYFRTATDAEILLVRPKEVNDGALPSANSVAVHNLVRLARLTGRPDFEDRAEALVTAFGREVAQFPSAHTHLLDGVQRAASSDIEIVICGERDDPHTHALLEIVRRSAPTRSCALLVQPGPEGSRARKLAPYTEHHTMIDDRPTAYVCRDHSCDRPTTDPARLARLLSTPSRRDDSESPTSPRRSSDAHQP